MKKHIPEAEALSTQKHQITEGQKRLTEIESGISELKKLRRENPETFDQLNSQLDTLIKLEGILLDPDCTEIDSELEHELSEAEEMITSFEFLPLLEVFEVNDGSSWNDFMESVRDYANKHNIEHGVDPFSALLTDSQRIAFEKRVEKDLTYQNAQCDKYDYMLAGTCGLIAGLVDVLFVGLPGQGEIGKAADDLVDDAVVNIAKITGWSGPREGSDPTASAMGYLERKFTVNYDQTHSNAMGRKGTGGQIKNLTPSNHHVKNLAHSPDLIGLLFSILNQFTSTSSFIDDGRLITINTETFELEGKNFAAKVFSGFCNWLGHLASDVAGSSGSLGRGTGIPIPFYAMLQFIDVGAFGQHRDTFAKVAVKVFEQGYDFRHGLALAVPVLIAELLTTMAWAFKQSLYHKKSWRECRPRSSNPELRRMLLVAQGTLCLTDTADAGVRSCGDMVQFMLRANLVAWVRFGVLAVRETRSWYATGRLEIEAANNALDAEYERLLSGVSGRKR